MITLVTYTPRASVHAECRQTKKYHNQLKKCWMSKLEEEDGQLVIFSSVHDQRRSVSVNRKSVIPRSYSASSFHRDRGKFLLRVCSLCCQISIDQEIPVHQPPLPQMALQDQHEIQAINQIAEYLDSGERRVIFYLCESLDTDNSVTCMKDMLKHKVTSHDTSDLLLTELMWQLRRYDILRKVFQTSREEVARILKYRHVLSRFRVLMANISEDMVNEDVNRAKFLLSSTLAREKLEKAKSFLDLLIELEKLDLVSPERVDFLEECLRNIDRIDLAKKVTAYKLQESLPVPTCREQSRQSQQELYKFNTNPRGVCVIIDCVGNDGGMLEQTFKALHFDVILHKWLSAEETLSAFREIVRQREVLERADGFVCCIISRGTESHLLGTDLYNRGLSLDNVRRLFTAEACPMLVGKPKLFFIQRKTNLVDAHIEVNGAIFEHNKRNPGAMYHIDLKHTLRKDLYLQ
ncbi:CASP8 and FADD-like apoptosis regulator [Collichthys lucidus]|uniref:CASP8 and FADD-like apoptosis regulator n=1 Tax=Collichthys lucidus TaxID=240159 RepID=A0A4U5U0W2_COLLU|nr:CASP8 and FADD-like apoptosis regulator [Collichthys lucidus]